MKVDPLSLNSELLMGQLSAFQQPPLGSNGLPMAIMRELFIYQVPVFAALAALTGTATNQLLIQADSDFEWTHAAYEFDIGASQTVWNTYPVPNMTVQIQDTGSGRYMSNAAVPVPSLFGMFPYAKPLPITKVFKANSSVAFTVTNFDAATATGNLRLSLIGWKLYYYDQASPAAR